MKMVFREEYQCINKGEKRNKGGKRNKEEKQEKREQKI